MTIIYTKTYKDNHYEVKLNNGNLHVFANEEIFNSFEPNIYNMADNNLLIPRNVHMSYTPDAHVGVGTAIGTTAVWNMKDGFVSPSIVGVDIGCGMRLLKTSLHKDDLKDKGLKRNIIEAIENYIPTSERTNSNYEDINLNSVVRNGLHGLNSKYINHLDEFDNVEHTEFSFRYSYLNDLPEKIWKVAHGQLGTLGGGNHFIEVQHISINEENADIATKWGLFDGQVVVMIHSGSRAWGNMLGKTFTDQIKEAMHSWGISNPDKNLIYAPINSIEGQRYLNLMNSALNFALVNRHMIGYGIGRAFDDLFGTEVVKVEVLYDLMHNYALKEFHRNQAMLVHRKGTTRALPAGHFMNPRVYKDTGHPALIPSSMGTPSYIMVGRDEGIKNFYSICHGSGRLRSRTATRQLVTVDQFEQSMKVGTADEVMVNHRMLKTILDESPQAYKNGDQVADSIVGAKLASVVARCHPMIAIKGV